MTGCTDERAAAEKLFGMGCRLLLVTPRCGGLGGVHAACGGLCRNHPRAGDRHDRRRRPVIGSFLYQLTRDGVAADGLDKLTEQQLTDYLAFSAQYASLTVQHKGAVMATLDELRQAYPTERDKYRKRTA